VMEERIGQGLDRERRPFPRAHADAHELSREEIDDRRDIDLLPAVDEFREVGRPYLVRMRGRGFEEQVREGPLSSCASGIACPACDTV
jgi:hypothetical protein